MTLVALLLVVLPSTLAASFVTIDTSAANRINAAPANRKLTESATGTDDGCASVKTQLKAKEDLIKKLLSRSRCDDFTIGGACRGGSYIVLNDAYTSEEDCRRLCEAQGEDGCCWRAPIPRAGAACEWAPKTVSFYYGGSGVRSAATCKAPKASEPPTPALTTAAPTTAAPTTAAPTSAAPTTAPTAAATPVTTTVKEDCYWPKVHYAGTVATTVSGKTCQAWASHQSPFRGMYAHTDSNYCRYPRVRDFDLVTAPWCFTKSCNTVEECKEAREPCDDGKGSQIPVCDPKSH